MGHHQPPNCPCLQGCSLPTFSTLPSTGDQQPTLCALEGSPWGRQDHPHDLLREVGPICVGMLLQMEGGPGLTPAPCSYASGHTTKHKHEQRLVQGQSEHVCLRAPVLTPSGPARGRRRVGQPGSRQATGPGLCHSEVVVALQQGGDSVLQGHSHLLGGFPQQWAVRVVFL